MGSQACSTAGSNGEGDFLPARLGGGVWLPPRRRPVGRRILRLVVPLATMAALGLLTVQGCVTDGAKSTPPSASDAPASPSTLSQKADRLVPRGLVRGGGIAKADRLAAHARPSARVASADGTPFAQRFPVASLFASPRKGTQAPDASPETTEGLPPGSVRTASLAPDPAVHLGTPQKARTELIAFDNSAFPYDGRNPRSGTGGRSRWQAARYRDDRVLMHIPRGFDPHRPGVIVVFFHGHGATLSRDVRDRQLVPEQISESGVNAVLLAPQLAVDAADSSAGKFWEPGGFSRFLNESAGRLARLYGDPDTEKLFSRMPVVVVGYSGGYVPTAWSLHVGGLGNRIRGVLLLDALYGELDKFASWIGKHRNAFFVSAYTHYTKRRDDELARMLSSRGIRVARELDGPLTPGTVAFLATGEGIRHRDYVTRAWTRNPIEDVLVRMARRAPNAGNRSAAALVRP
ncbi:hypothetical protein A33M_3852 [Rhodovulum sp. PH10]|nr:hypothetical protein A33M_3852 [Rhodovulum sp. PH10]